MEGEGEVEGGSRGGGGGGGGGGVGSRVEVEGKWRGRGGTSCLEHLLQTVDINGNHKRKCESVRSHHPAGLPCGGSM